MTGSPGEDHALLAAFLAGDRTPRSVDTNPLVRSLKAEILAADGAAGGQAVAPGAREAIAAAPLVAGPAVVAAAVLLGAPGEALAAAAGVVGREPLGRDRGAPHPRSRTAGVRPASRVHSRVRCAWSA